MAEDIVNFDSTLQSFAVDRARAEGLLTQIMGTNPQLEFELQSLLEFIESALNVSEKLVNGEPLTDNDYQFVGEVRQVLSDAQTDELL